MIASIASSCKLSTFLHFMQDFHWPSRRAAITKLHPQLGKAPTCYRSLPGPSGPKCPGSVPGKRGCPRVSHGVSPAPFGLRAPECPKSVPRVFPECRKGIPDTLGTLFGYFLDAPEPGARKHLVEHSLGPECTKIARFSAVAAAIFTARGKIARLFEASRCAISSTKKIASEPRFFLRCKLVK